VLAGEGATVASNTGITAMIALLCPSEPDARFLPQFLRGYPQEIKGVVGTLAAQSWGEHGPWDGCLSLLCTFLELPTCLSTTRTYAFHGSIYVCLYVYPPQQLQTTWHWPARPHHPPRAVTGTPCPSPSHGCGEVWALGAE
jgi:hypothetical protein